MFAYCLNNPVNGWDPLGIWPKWIDDAFRKGKELIEDFKEDLEEIKEHEEIGTLVVGIDYLFGFGLGTSGNAGIGIDAKGNIGFVLGMFYGGGMPGVSLTGFVSVSDASNLDNLGGNSFSAGASGGEGAVFGGEVTVMPGAKNGKTAIAGSFQMGVGVGLPIEAHGQYGETNVWSVNVFDLLIKGCDYVLQWDEQN